MPLQSVLEERLNAALALSSPIPFTARDARLPPVPGKAHAVVGMRRSGKATFLRQLLAERRASLRAERVLYLSFDDDRLVGIGVEQLGFLLEEFYRRYPALRGRQPVLWLLDEVQLVPGWERFVRRAMDSERTEFVVSGSSARMLSREVHTSGPHRYSWVHSRNGERVRLKKKFGERRVGGIGRRCADGAAA